MEKVEMMKLLTFENGQLLIEGHDLVELANMYHLSVEAFFDLFNYYLMLNQKQLKGECILTNNQSVTYGPLKEKKDLILKKSKEILIDGEEYEDMKKRIFDFAYTRCSDIGATNFESWGLSCADDDCLVRTLKDSNDTYSCIYHSVHYERWNQKVSNVPIDKADQAKRFALIKKDN